MKKVLFLSAIVFWSLNSVAQTSKSSWLVGGSLGFSSTKQDGSEKTSSSSVEFSPNVGYFLANDVAVGLDFDLSSETNGFNSSSYSGFGTFVRYYFPAKSKTAKLFGNFDLAFLNKKENKTSFNSTRYGLGVGGVYFANKNVGIESAIGYSFETAPEYVNTIRTFGMKVGVQVYFGK